jgi:hypothetical protein
MPYNHFKNYVGYKVKDSITTNLEACKTDNNDLELKLEYIYYFADFLLNVNTHILLNLTISTMDCHGI